ncbi:MAG: DUF2029 domain-containing protein [Gemmatimonadota bacterium]|nr:DUF2029 domain-containing protein [Gemmatimonadota bacterium]
MTDPGFDRAIDGGGQRPLRWMLALYVATAVAVALQRSLGIPPENNFLIFRASFEHLRHAQDLYAAYPAEYSDRFKYSPTFALLFAPFALPPLVPAFVLWSTVCALVVFAGVRGVLPAGRAALALGIAWLAVLGDLQRAQTNALCAGLILVGWAAMERRRQSAAAGAIMAGGFIKLFPIAALSGGIFHPRKARFALSVAAAVLIGLALPLLVTHASTLRMQYASWRAIEARDAVPLAQYGSGGADLYAGVMGLFRTWFGVDWPFWPQQLVGIVILLAPLVRGPRAWTAGFRLTFVASILVFCVLFNHQAESPSYSIAMIGAAVWYAASDRAWWRTVLIAACLALVNLASTSLMPTMWYQHYYVRYMLKTVPLVPLWLAMQAELFGCLGDGRSEIAKVGEREVAAAQPLD